jgi:acyl-CoA thioester hydrolase
VRLTQIISRDGQRLCAADVTVVLVSVSGKPLRLSQTMRLAFGVTAPV